MNRVLFFVIAILAGTGSAATLRAQIPEPVALDTGRVTGVPAGTSGVRVFKAIPYAAPPVGDLRWRPPVPPATWSGIRDGSEFSETCVQGRGGSEDCLYLNVWTGAASADERRGVFFWIYGGGFTSGSGSEARYDGEALAAKGLVVVTFNYRLGVFGFLAHPELTAESDRDASGNYGILDAVAALEWVQRNISRFGGDPGNVTIAGESAGARAVALLVGSPRTGDLFGRAIAQSGGWMGLNTGPMKTLDEAESDGLGAAEDSGATSIAELRAKEPGEIRGASDAIVDGWLIPEDLSIAYAEGRQNAVDLLVGSNRDEGTFFVRGSTTSEQFRADAGETYGDLAADYLVLYPASTDAEATASQLAASTDSMGWQMHLWAMAQQNSRRGRAYLYYFTREEPAAAGRPSRGATHTADLPYMFRNLTPGRDWTDVDRRLADQMSSYWVNFARTGDPNGPGLPVWPAYRGDDETEIMILGGEVRPGAGTLPARLGFFDRFYRTLFPR